MIIGIGLTLRATLLGSTAVSDPYAVAGFSPPLVFDFAEEFYRTGGSTTTFDAAMTHSRSGNATYVDASGAIQTVSTDEPRVGHHIWNGSAWVNAGYLHESEVRVQLLHTTNALVTQSHTVTAVPHTLHFTGTGTITLSGASTAGPLVGTGTGENNRVSLTFTPSAASLTLTVSGTVTNAQLEVGSTPSSYIPNLASSGTVTRAADTITVPYANLPWPTPNVIGEELVTNGTFDTDTDWTKGTGWTISGGVANHAVGTASSLEQASILTPEKVYQVTVDATATGGTWALQFVGGATTTVGSSLGSGSHSLIGVAGPSNVTLRVFGGSSTDLTIDNISVREIDPISVSIQMDGKMTYADEGGTEVIWFDWRLNSSNYVQANLRTQAAATGEVYQLQAANGVGDDVDGRSSQYSPGINVPFNIASRHGSTFINGAVDGVALTADLTPTALPALSASNLQLGFNYMGTIKKFRMWSDDLGDTGIEEATA